MRSHKGFTLIELLIVIAILAILAAIVFVALDPLTRFRDARDSRRWADVSSIVSALRVAQVDKGGAYIYGVRHDAASATSTGTFMIINNTVANGTSTHNSACNTSCSAVTSATSCADFSQLVSRGYLGTIPVSPNGNGSWSATGYTGYYVKLNSNNSVTVGACEAENTSSITVTR